MAQKGTENEGLVNRNTMDHQVVDSEESCYSCYKDCYGNCTGFLATWVCCICCDTPYRRINEGTTGIVTRFGKFKNVLSPGLHFVNMVSEELIIVEKREQVMDLRQQKVITKDNISVIIDAVVYFQIENSYRSVFGIDQLLYGIKELALTSMRDVFGTTTLQEALEDRDKAAEALFSIIALPAAKWGVSVKRILLQEILFTPELQKTLSSAATAKRLAESKVIGAQADVQSAKLMRNASDILATPSAMQIRYLDSIASVGKVGNPKILFFPSDYKLIGSKALQSMGKNKM